MRKRTLLAIVLVVVALPVFAQPPKLNPDTLTAIADLQADGAFDDFATPGSQGELLASARENYRKALQIDPKHKDALLGLARLHARLGERHQAVEAYRNYLRHYPDDGEVRREMVRVKVDGQRVRDYVGSISRGVGVEPEQKRELLFKPHPAARGSLSGLGTAIRTQPAQLIISAMVVKVPRDFVTQSGLNVGAAPDAKAWTLSPRETQMLTGLLRAAKERGESDVLTRPQLCLSDGQTGYVCVGQDCPVVASGVTGDRHVEYALNGMKIEFAPKMSADGGLSLGVHFQNTEVQGTAIRKQAVRATAALRFGETLVLAAPASESRSLCGTLRNLSGDSTVTLLIAAPVKIATGEYVPAPWDGPVRPAGFVERK